MVPQAKELLDAREAGNRAFLELECSWPCQHLHRGLGLQAVRQHKSLVSDPIWAALSLPQSAPPTRHHATYHPELLLARILTKVPAALTVGAVTTGCSLPGPQGAAG